MVGGGPHLSPGEVTLADHSAYASEAISQIEGRVGSTENPFGRDHWY